MFHVYPKYKIHFIWCNISFAQYSTPPKFNNGFAELFNIILHKIRAILPLRFVQRTGASRRFRAPNTNPITIHGYAPTCAEKSLVRSKC
jgi:hypothetical protein